MSTVSGNHINQNVRSFDFRSPASLLMVSGVALVVGYLLHLAGFGGWMTLAVAGASLLAAVALRGNYARLAIPAVVIAIEGAILCTMALPDQLGSGEVIAAVVNLAIIAAFIAAAAMILRQPQ